MSKKQQVLLFAQGLDGMSTEKEAQNIFLNLEKRNNVKKHIRKLHVSGVITTDPFKILDEQKRFYHDLYKSKSTVMDCNIGETFLSNLNIPKLSEEQKQSCEGEISLEEIKLILDSFQNNKSPGSDGIPIEFYKTCWNLIRSRHIDLYSLAGLRLFNLSLDWRKLRF